MQRHPDGSIQWTRVASLKRGQRAKLFKFLIQAVDPNSKVDKAMKAIAKVLNVDHPLLLALRQGNQGLDPEEVTRVQEAIDAYVKDANDESVTEGWERRKGEVQHLGHATEDEKNRCRKFAPKTSAREVAEEMTVQPDKGSAGPGFQFPGMSGVAIQLGPNVTVWVVVNQPPSKISITPNGRGGVEFEVTERIGPM